MQKKTKKKKKRGFTLIELLTVIIILGVLMIIAVPSVSEYIQMSRKEGYVKMALQYISGARTKINSQEIPIYDIEATYYLPAKCIALEKGGESPFGNLDEAYIVVTYDGFSYDYYWTSRDSKNMGILLTDESLLTKESVKTGVSSINTEIGIDNKEKILLINDCDGTNIVEDMAFTTISKDGKLNENPPQLVTLTTAIKEEIVMDNKPSKYVINSNGIDFSRTSSDNNGKGIYIRAGTENDINPIYYFRGEVDNNNVLFANICWKIVRTTEKGGVKLIYNGTLKDGTCSNTEYETEFESKAYNEKSSSIAYLGYMYGNSYDGKTSLLNPGSGIDYVYGNDVEYSNGKYTLKDTYVSENGWAVDYETIGSRYHYTCFTTSDTCEKVNYIYKYNTINNGYYIVLENGKTVETALQEMTSESSNTVSSPIKSKIDKWYEENLIEYTDKLEDSIWCNDRTISYKGGWDKDTPADREIEFSPLARHTSKEVKLTCSNKSDSFTVSKDYGNGNLKYPIGLLTMDEAKLAGGTTSYLASDKLWWLLSPRGFGYYGLYAYNFLIEPSGSIIYVYSVFNTAGNVRPAITLKANTKIKKGDGTINNPYIIK